MSFAVRAQGAYQSMMNRIGEPCTLTPKSGAAPIPFNGILDVTHGDAGGSSFNARAADYRLHVIAPTTGTIGDTATVRGKAYKIARIEPDASGSETWVLQP